MFEKNMKIAYLIDFYEDILDPHVASVMRSYYDDDLSLAEIAESAGITRQAVREAIKKSEAELFFYEEKLGLLQRFTEAQIHAARALALCDEADSIPVELKQEVETLIKIVSTDHEA